MKEGKWKGKEKKRLINTSPALQYIILLYYIVQHTGYRLTTDTTHPLHSVRAWCSRPSSTRHYYIIYRRYRLNRPVCMRACVFTRHPYGYQHNRCCLLVKTRRDRFPWGLRCRTVTEMWSSAACTCNSSRVLSTTAVWSPCLVAPRRSATASASRWNELTRRISRPLVSPILHTRPAPDTKAKTILYTVHDNDKITTVFNPPHHLANIFYKTQ